MQAAGLEDLTPHYVETLHALARELHRQHGGAGGAGLRRAFRRIWTLYLAYCEAGFAERRICEHPAAADQTRLSPHLPRAPGTPGRIGPRRACGERMINSLLDSVLDRTVIGGYTNVGYRIRSRGWSASELRPLGGRVVMVTGAELGPRARRRGGLRAPRRDGVAGGPQRGARGAGARRGRSSDPATTTYTSGDAISAISPRCGSSPGASLRTAERLDVLVNNAGVLPKSEASRPTGSS